MKAGRDDKKGTEQQELQTAGGGESVQMEESTLCSLAFHLNEDTMCEIKSTGQQKTWQVHYTSVWEAQVRHSAICGFGAHCRMLCQSDSLGGSVAHQENLNARRIECQ